MNDDRLLDAIRPLEQKEYSFQRVLAGESRSMATYLEGKTYPVPWYIRGKRNVFLNQQQIAYQRLADQSVLPHEEFWASEIQELEPSWQGRLLSMINAGTLGMFQGYLDVQRYLDVQLAILRAIRNIYLGADPNDHGEAPIPGFVWSWDEQDRKLCLKLVGAEANSKQAERIQMFANYCMPVSGTGK